MKFLKLLSFALLIGIIGCSKEDVSEETALKEVSFNWSKTADTSRENPFFGMGDDYRISKVGSYLKMQQKLNPFKVISPLASHSRTATNVVYEFNNILYGHDDGEIFKVDASGNIEYFYSEHIGEFNRVWYSGGKAFFKDANDGRVVYCVDLITNEQKQLNLGGINLLVKEIYSDFDQDSEKIVFWMYEDEDVFENFSIVEYDLSLDQIGTVKEFDKFRLVQGFNDGIMYISTVGNELIAYNTSTGNVVNSIITKSSSITIGDNHIVIRDGAGGENYDVFDLNFEKESSFSCNSNSRWIILDDNVYIAIGGSETIEIREFNISSGNNLLFARNGITTGNKVDQNVFGFYWYDDQQSFVLDIRRSPSTQLIASYSWE